MATRSIRLTATGEVVGNGAIVFGVTLEGGVGGAGDVTFKDGGAGGAEIFRRGTDVASQKRHYTLEGLPFSQSVYATLGANVAAVSVEFRDTI